MAEYILAIEDTQGRTGPLFVYRVEIEPVHETTLTYLSMNDGVPMPRLLGVAIPRGSHWTIDLQLAPGLGSEYKGDMVVEASGLPRGVEMIAQPVVKGQNRVPVQFYASDDAEARIQFFFVDRTVRSRRIGRPRSRVSSHQSVATHESRHRVGDARRISQSLRDGRDRSGAVPRRDRTSASAAGAERRDDVQDAHCAQ